MSTGESSRRRFVRHAMNLRMDLATAQLFALFGASRLDAVLLRGPAIARHLYREGERRYNDIDILVRRPDQTRVAAVLRDAGYGLVSDAPHEQHWRRSSDGCMVDLHFSLWGATASAPALWDALAARRETFALGGAQVVVPAPAGVAFVIALHASQHGALIPHVTNDLRRAVALFARDVWTDAALCAERSGASFAFRQGLSTVPAGRSLLAELGLAPADSRQLVLRRRGIELPAYLFESLPWRERVALVRGRILPPRSEVAAFVEPRAAGSTAWLLVAHARRFARVPVRTLRLAAWWHRAGARSAVAPHERRLRTDEPN